jgi:hypothetical protein
VKKLCIKISGYARGSLYGDISDSNYGRSKVRGKIGIKIKIIPDP